MKVPNFLLIGVLVAAPSWSYAAESDGALRKDRGVKKQIDLTPPQDDKDTEIVGDLNDAVPLGYGAIGRGPGSWGKSSGHGTALRGAYVMSERWEIGVDLRYPEPRVSASTGNYSGYQMRASQTAFLFGNIMRPHKLIHPAYRVLVGGLTAVLENDDDTQSSATKTNSFYVIEPEAAIELNLTKYTKLSAALGYRLVSKGAQSSGPITPADVTGYDLNFLIAFGNFRF